MAIKIVSSALIILGLSIPTLANSCRPKLVTAGEVKEQAKNTGKVAIASITRSKFSKRCKRKLTVILPSVLHANRIDIANINSFIDEDLTLKILGQSSIHANEVAIGNVQGFLSLKVNRDIKVRHIEANRLTLAETKSLPKSRNVTVDNTITVQRFRQSTSSDKTLSKDRLMQRVRNNFKRKKGSNHG